MAVQIVPDGVEPLLALNRAAARKRGIRIIQCGEGYWSRTGPKSMLGRARIQAEHIADQINTGQWDGTGDVPWLED